MKTIASTLASTLAIILLSLTTYADSPIAVVLNNFETTILGVVTGDSSIETITTFSYTDNVGLIDVGTNASYYNTPEQVASFIQTNLHLSEDASIERTQVQNKGTYYVYVATITYNDLNITDQIVVTFGLSGEIGSMSIWQNTHEVEYAPLKSFD